MCRKSIIEIAGITIIVFAVLLYSFQRVLDIINQEKHEGYYLSGKVVSACGSPLEKVDVFLYANPILYPEAPDSKGVTDTSGTFHFYIESIQDYLLEVKGEAGTGRIRITSGDILSEKIEITYPVIEEIIILHTNDQHFHLNCMQKKNHLLEEFRKEYDDVFLLSAGDIFVRHPHRWMYNGQVMDSIWYGMRALQMISVMNDIGYDIMTLGNHELDYIKPYTGKALKLANFSLLAANIDITTIEFPNVKDYAFLITSTWRKIAVLGITTLSSLKEGVKELDIFKTIHNNLFLKEFSEIFIALTHIGIENELQIANKYPEFDIIIGGHSHAPLPEAIMENYVLVAHSGGNPHLVSHNNSLYIGIIAIRLKNGNLIEKTGRVIEIRSDNDNFSNKLTSQKYQYE